MLIISREMDSETQKTTVVSFFSGFLAAVSFSLLAAGPASSVASPEARLLVEEQALEELWFRDADLCLPLTRLTARWFTVFRVFLLTSGCSSLCAQYARFAKNITSFTGAGERGSEGRLGFFFPLVLRGLLLYIRHCELLRSHSSCALQERRQQPAAWCAHKGITQLSGAQGELLPNVQAEETGRDRGEHATHIYL